MSTSTNKKIQEYVVGLAFNSTADEVVLIRKLKPTWQRGLLNGVGGKIEPRELPEVAMAREFKEETGVLIEDRFWKKFLVMYGETFTVHFFRTFTDEIVKCTTIEAERVARLDALPVAKDAVPNLQWIIPLALDNIEPFAVFDNGGSEAGKPSRLCEVLDALRAE